MGLTYNTLLNVAFKIGQSYMQSEVARWNQFQHASAMRSRGILRSNLLSTLLASLGWMVCGGYIEDREIRMLELQTFLAYLKRTIPNGQQLLLVEEQIPLVIDSPLVFPRHRKGIDRAGLNTQSTKQTARHVH